MAEVSVGLRGWRFEESRILASEGEFKPFNKTPEDPWERLMRLVSLVEEPCDVCYLTHGNKKVQQRRQTTIIYDEPHEEVLLCEHHEPDFPCWFREEDGHDLTDDAVFANAFHEWFAAGGHAPDGYGGLEHVDAEPDELPSPPDANEIRRWLEENFVEGERINLRDYGPGADDEDGTPLTEDDLDGVDLDTDYPTK